MDKHEVGRLQVALRRMLASPELMLVMPRGGGSVQARVAGEIVGTVVPVTDEDEPSWVLTVPILLDDF